MIARIGKISLRVFLGILIALIVFLLTFDRLVQFRMNDKEIVDWFHNHKIEPQIGYFKGRGPDDSLYASRRQA